MGVDLHRIGTGISSGTSRTGFGTIVSFPSASGFPAAGTFNSWLYDVTYPIANGGADLIDPSGVFEPTPSQFCDVQVENDGSGGTYTDWTTATDIQYFANGTVFLVVENGSWITYITINGIQYTNGTYNNTYIHNGSGGWSDFEVPTFEVIDTLFGTQTQNTTVYIVTNCNGSIYVTTGNYPQSYYSDGVGGYYSTDGSTTYIGNGTEIFSESCYDSITDSYVTTTYLSDGSGGYYT